MLEYNEGQRKDIKMEEDGDEGQAKDKGRGSTEKDKTVEFVSRQESLNDEKREEPVMDYNGIEIRVIQEDELSVEDEEFHNNWDEEQEEIGEGDDRGGENTEQRVEDNRREDNGVKKDQALGDIREESDVAEFEENNVRVKQEDELIIPDDDDDEFGADWYKEEN
ncbi:hypothetical protein LSTR_LSTR013696 [Laodelphax striatellus]|uniref:Uncharacterized protein n=1 Tax=Laodelphax striatellus TaxID=195883 RepID=A0A482WZL3_LAOST|nr:hypothetical protein LSTR_LSTR013696 [Laodelphax striatellus]